VLSPFGNADLVGRSFGVVKLRLGGAEYDFSLPRRAKFPKATIRPESI